MVADNRKLGDVSLDYIIYIVSVELNNLGGREIKLNRPCDEDRYP
jgi:hypothetical protein